MVLAAKSATVYDWDDPLIKGVGSLETWVAEVQLEEVIEAVEYLISYCAAVPADPSSPGDVQLRVIEFWAKLEAERLVIWEGAVMSGAAWIV